MPEWLLQLVGIVAGGASVYAAIRSDLARLAERVESVKGAASDARKEADRAHVRIDGLMIRGN